MTHLPESQETPMSKRRQRGFSLLELLVAMMIIGVIATLGFRGYIKQAARSKHLGAADKVKIMADGLDMHYIQKGKYPEGASWDALIAPDSALVKGNMIPANMPSKDPWDQPFEVTVTKGSYTVRCAGDPSNQEELGEIVRQPGRLSGAAAQESKPESKEGAPK